MAHLLLRGMPEAPTFDGIATHLNRYFQEIDHLYSSRGIRSTDEQKIQQTKMYLDYDTFDLWDILTPPSTPQTVPRQAPAVPVWTWNAFKDAVRKYYPGSDDDRLYSVNDLEQFVHDTATKGVRSKDELGKYYWKFSLISHYLRSHGYLSQFGLDCLFICGFGDATWARIEHRLSIVEPDHHPDDVYSMDLVFNAAQFLLSGSSTLTPTSRGVPSVSSTVSGTSPSTGLTSSEFPILVAAISTTVASAVRNCVDEICEDQPVQTNNVLTAPAIIDPPAIEETTFDPLPPPTVIRRPTYGYKIIDTIPAPRIAYDDESDSCHSNCYGNVVPVLLGKQTPEDHVEVDSLVELPFSETPASIPQISSDLTLPVPKPGIYSGLFANTVLRVPQTPITSFTISKCAIRQVLEMINTDNIDIRPFISYRPNPMFTLRVLSAQSPPQVPSHVLSQITLPQMMQSYRIWNMGIRGTLCTSPIPSSYSGISEPSDLQSSQVIVRPNQPPVTHAVCYPVYSESFNGRPRLYRRDRRRIVKPKSHKRVRLTYKPRVHH